MPLMTGKQALMEMPLAEGVRYIFGNPGTSESAIMSSLSDYRDIKYVLVTQEGVAMGMADGYSSATGVPSLVNLHIDTGLANGVSLLHHAMDGGVPLVLTAGGRKSYPPLMMVKVMLLQQWYETSDPAMEEVLLDRLLRKTMPERQTRGLGLVHIPYPFSPRGTRLGGYRPGT